MKRQKIMSKMVATVLLSAVCYLPAKAQLSNQSSHLFLGQKPSAYNEPVTSPSLCFGPNFSVEFTENGLNFWRPYPATFAGNYKLFIDQTGKVGINGRKPVTHSLEVNGKVWTTDGLLIASDERLKRNIKNISESKGTYLGKLMRLSGKTYEKQTQSSADNAKEIARMVATGKIRKQDEQAALRQLNETQKDVFVQENGFLAQDVKALFPELVETDAEGTMAVDYTGLIPVLLEAVKELQNRINNL
jgi:hypothetical protein